MDDRLVPTGHFSVLRWRHDGTRDEARNVAVILVGGGGRQAVVRAAPISSISPKLHDQGILDTWINGLERQFESATNRCLDLLTELHNSLDHSLYLTPPRPTAVPDLDTAVGALYRAFVAPRGHGGREFTTGKLLDLVVSRLRRAGLNVRRGEYIESFLFDAVIDRPAGTSALEVLSFATSARNWVGAEHNAGHFLYAVSKLSLPAAAVIKPPMDLSNPTASAAYERVSGWLADENVEVLDPEQAAALLA